MSSPFKVITVKTKPYEGQKPGTSGLRKRCTLDAGLGDKKKGATLVVGGDGRYYCPETVNIIIQMAAANGLRKLIVGQNGFLSTPAVSCLIRKREINDGSLINGGIILTASHNPGGPKADFGIKFNCENGGPAPEKLTEAIYALSKSISEYYICNDLHADFTKIGKTDYNIDGYDVFTVHVIDSVKDYVQLMEQIFDFSKIKELLSGQTMGQFNVLIDSLYGATGPYVNTILVEKLSVDPKFLCHTTPKPDFGGGHPDPNLTYAKQLVDTMEKGEHDFGAAFDGDGDRNMILGKNGFFVTPSDSLAVIAANMKCIPYFQRHGIKGYLISVHDSFIGYARSMPTAGAVDRVAKETGLPIYETPTGWKFFGNLMDAGKLSLCGEESFGTGSDHIRYDYENCDVSGANLMMTFIESQMQAFIGQKFTANEKSFIVKQADNFAYTDPIDNSVSQKQGLRILFEDGSRTVFRLSGTGSMGATVRLYVDSFIDASDKQRLFRSAEELLKPLVLVALQLSKLEHFTGRNAPTVIT
ncbi:phosphoglucomutase/phosphomannomutase, alpha/beta/alpha domain II [Onchocerca flexuosa]|uniref:phosphoglucomutase (alpha-D-glucose-1,6-bisphosphate-dependent) n=1 Tax=Onchocerca flexuosa TaxID=387005 RepID=A0A238C2Y6_9BILA|nr:phosphoglucomutase/phosphomannomutase, alpha/beta/alpha domain II [Onchocerca flexuosa]